MIVLATVSGLVSGAYFSSQERVQRTAIEQGLAAEAAGELNEAAAICGELPGPIHAACFAGNLSAFVALAGDADVCTARPPNVSERRCRDLMDWFVIRKDAVSAGDLGLCNDIRDVELQADCLFGTALESARSQHDINVCNELPDRTAAQSCRVQYVNANLLFNPDSTICQDLDEGEREDCEINTAIYRLSGTADFDGCESLPQGAQEHCRYVIASSLVGRNQDISGCQRLKSSALAERCEAQLSAWQAERSESLQRCADIPGSLRESCYLRVAGRLIEGRLTNYALSAGVSDGSVLAEGSEESARPAPPAAPSIDWQRLTEQPAYRIEWAPYTSQSGTGKGFQRFNGADLGIARSWRFRMTDFFEPFLVGKGVASGDFNDDGWPDLLLATERGVALYQNIGGSFTAAQPKLGALADENVFLVALVDADGDGLEDIFASAYGGKNYLLKNDGAGFAASELTVLSHGQIITLSAGFADLDRDGQLDIALGNWTSGVEKLFAPERSQNLLLFGDNGSHRAVPLDEVLGETNTLLVADINDDQNTDILIGNDQIVPDVYYLGSANGSLRRIEKQAVPATTLFTMSLDAADFNNDLVTDLFMTDMTFAQSSARGYCDPASGSERESCERMLDAYRLFQEGSALDCGSLEDGLRADCYSAFAIKAAKASKDASYCDGIRDAAALSLCQHLAQEIGPQQIIHQSEYADQVQRNVLLIGDGKSFSERAVEWGVSESFWSWNARAADLDNDTWQDIYVGNGFHFGDSFYEIQENVAFRNENGQRFVSVGSRWGLNDPVNTPSYTYSDIDLDGDLDIVATGVITPVRVFLNHLGGKSVTFLLRDQTGNTRAIGAKVTIRYGGDHKLQQRKELKLSGGFMSFDNPVLHFGLGQYDAINEVTVHWPDGTVFVQDGPLQAGRLYRLTRKRGGVNGGS